MLLSMTGFSHASFTLTGPNDSKTNIGMTLKSLNSRFFESTCKIPYPLNILETECIKLFRKKLYRGHVFFTVNISSQDIFTETIEPSLKTIKAYLDAFEKVNTTFNLTGSFTITDLIRLPNTFTAQERELDEINKKKIFDALNTLIAELINTRTIEGNALEQDILHRIKLIKEELQKIAALQETVMLEQKKLIHEKRNFLESSEYNADSNVIQILYNELDKVDIQEEITRFNTHLDHLTATIENDSIEKGRRLDFVLQELNREVNTICAKTPSPIISSSAINIKVEVEKIREQVQNIV